MSEEELKAIEEIIHKIKWVCSKKYRQECIDFEENPFDERK